MQFVVQVKDMVTDASIETKWHNFSTSKTAKSLYMKIWRLRSSITMRKPWNSHMKQVKGVVHQLYTDGLYDKADKYIDKITVFLTHSYSDEDALSQDSQKPWWYERVHHVSSNIPQLTSDEPDPATHWSHTHVKEYIKTLDPSQLHPPKHLSAPFLNGHFWSLKSYLK